MKRTTFYNIHGYCLVAGNRWSCNYIKGPYVSKIVISRYKPDQKKSYIDSSKAARIKFAIDV